MKAIGSVMLFLFSIIWSIYVLLPYDKCVRVERMSAPVAWIGSGVETLLSPWVGEENHYRVVSNFVRIRVMWSNYLRKQFFSDSDGNVEGCGWDGLVIPKFEETEIGVKFLAEKKAEEIETSVDTKEESERKKCWFFFDCSEPVERKETDGVNVNFTGTNDE